MTTTTSSFLLQSPTLNWKTHLHHSPQSPPRPSNANFRITIVCFKRLSVKCSLPNNNDSVGDKDINRKFGFEVNMESEQNPFEFGAKSIINALKALQIPTAAALIVGLLLIYDSNSALAAGSGGRMGGSAFSSRSESKSSRSYSAPRSEAKSSSYSKPKSEAKSSSSYSKPKSEAKKSSRSYSKPKSEAKSSRSYSKPKSEAKSSRSYSKPKSEAKSSRSYSKPKSEPSFSSNLLWSMLQAGSGSSSNSWSSKSSEAKSSRSYSKPKSEPSSSSNLLWSMLQAGSGSSSNSGSSKSSEARSYSAPRVEPEVESGFSYSVYEPSPLGGVSVSPAADVESGAFLILIAFVAFVLVSGFMSGGSKSSNVQGSKSSNVLTDDKKTSVLKVQVGLLGLGRSLQKDLNRIAETADTSTSEGLHYILTETVLALLRHPDYCISTYSSVDIKKNMDEGEDRFNQLSIEERGKFVEETLVNVNNIKKQSSTNLRGSGFSNEYIVVTMLVAADGVRKLPSINNSKDLKEALQKLASIPSSRILAVEVLWTPQNEDDTLTERELLEDYPLLRPL